MTDECTPIPLPLMGEGVHEASVVKWLKKLGDKVSKDEALLEVSTDKVDTEIASPREGYLVGIDCQEGATVKVDQVLGYIAADPSTQAPQRASIATPPLAKPRVEAPPPQRGKAPSPQRPLPSSPQSPSPGSYAGAVRSSPLVRKLAQEMGINLREVRGSGLYGRITKEDLLRHGEEGGSRIAQPLLEAPLDPWEEYAKQTTLVKDGQEYLDGVPVTRKAMSKIRRLTAEHMLRSVRTSPHVTTTFEIDLHRVAAFKKSQDAKGLKLTYTAFFIHAAIEALKLYPEVNASIDGYDILYKEQIHIGCAVALENGLIVPVLKNAGSLDLLGVAKGLQDLVSRAREKKLSPQDVQGGTFSITNPGMFGSLHSQPIINQPQVAILSVGAIIERPVYFAKEICVHPLVQVGLTFDHRLIDGEGGARFLAAIKHYLENF